jgi:hypothetical protein
MWINSFDGKQNLDWKPNPAVKALFFCIPRVGVIPLGWFKRCWWFNQPWGGVLGAGLLQGMCMFGVWCWCVGGGGGVARFSESHRDIVTVYVPGRSSAAMAAISKVSLRLSCSVYPSCAASTHRTHRLLACAALLTPHLHTIRMPPCFVCVSSPLGPIYR